MFSIVRGLCAPWPVNWVEAGRKRGPDLVYTLVSSKDDWDRYEGLQWHVLADYARTDRDNADLPELRERVAKGSDRPRRY